MGVSVRIVVAFLMISAVTAVPTGDARKAVLNNEGQIDSHTLPDPLQDPYAASESRTQINESAAEREHINTTTPPRLSESRLTDYGVAPSQDETSDLNAESSEIISEAVAPPPYHKYEEPETAATADHTEHSIEALGDSQNFFPTFANLFEPRQNNFRLGFNNQEAAYSQRPNSYRSLLNYPLFGGNRNVDFFGKSSTPAAAPLVDASSSVLGSGNFGIIRGGTFFAQNDEDSSEFDSFNSYYNNGHGRPSYDVGYIANPRPNYNQDQFANFRDFADINTPSNSAYSHFVVVYANKNSTMDEISEETRRVLSEPKNIIETLERLDETTTTAPKISKSKAKLELTKQKMMNKKDQWKKINLKSYSQKHDPEEPLLALS